MYVDYDNGKVRLSAALACHDADREISLKDFVEILGREAAKEADPLHYTPGAPSKCIHRYRNPYFKHDNAKDWNDNAPTEPTTEQVTSYRALMIAGPSEKGQELAAKVNAGEALTWEDVSSANWSVANSSSPAGYIYPSLWLQENFDHNITDLPHAVQSDSYGSAFARLASGQVDILCTYADARRDYEDEWTGEYGMTNSIWDDTAVVGVTPAIYNDTISVSKTSPIMDDDFKAALSEAFINIGNTEEGKEVIAIYSHNGYLPAQSSDYDSERAAQEMIQSLNSAG